MKKRKLKIKNIIILLFGMIIITIASVIGFYFYELSPVNSKSNEEIEVVIPSGSSKKSIGRILKEKNLIRNDTIFMIYVKLNKVGNLKASTYKLKKSMSVKEIIKTLEDGNSYNPNEIKITFKEGLNIRQIAKLIEDNTSNSSKDVLKKVEDKDYIKELISKYSFLSDKILNKNIYYSLEGFLFPDTYIFKNKDVSVEEIFKTMLDKMDKVLTNYKEDIDKSKKDIFDIITMASLIEKEGKTEDFKNISSVFYNRISINMKLESCASAIYGIKKEFSDYVTNRAITNTEMSNNNPYNTYVVQLPVGPICSPSKEAIEAAINPNDSKYLYFLSDVTGKTYFFEKYSEHQAKRQELIQAGKWN